MLENEFGNRLRAEGNGTNWRLFAPFLAELAISDPLRDALRHAVDAVVAQSQAGNPVIIDSTIHVAQVLASIPAGWQTEYRVWHDRMHRAHPTLPPVDPGQMYGMALWNHLAADRQERWRMREGAHRLYELLP
jgi:hypothetical protein